MKIPKQNYVILIAAVSAWLASLTMVLIPTIGVTTPVYPPPPSFGYKLILLILTAGAAAAVSMSLGIQHIKRYIKSRSLDAEQEDQSSTDTVEMIEDYENFVLMPELE